VKSRAGGAETCEFLAKLASSPSNDLFDARAQITIAQSDCHVVALVQAGAAP
jgi:hypothetical protein